MKKEKNAIILAAGFGMRMVPINTIIPKALVEVNGETLIERLIGQLHEVGITDICIVVGFMKERFTYLSEKYEVTFIENDLYEQKNNLHSLALAADHLSDTYVIPCDIWCEKNPFSERETGSWYMISEEKDTGSNIEIVEENEIRVNEAPGNRMIGITYLQHQVSEYIKQRLFQFDQDHRYDTSFWEDTLYEGDRMIIPARIVPETEVVEINTYEQLRRLDINSNDLKVDAITIITEVLDIFPSDIVNITVLKKGMTNRSFLFECRGDKYIMRIPGEGTEKLINRKQEAQVYRAIEKYDISDEVIYIDPERGYKITRFLNRARGCDSENIEDLKRCMKRLRDFHSLKIKVGHEFDLFGQIIFYESLRKGRVSVYPDYEITRKNVFSLKSLIEENVEERCLTHIDAVQDNFLFTEDGDVHLIDWEYAGMQDPHVDIAMFCIYALYDRTQVDRLIDIYFEGKCTDKIRQKIYAYIAVAGLLWSNWCEYKKMLGIEFGDYALMQYQYAKEYYQIVEGEKYV